VHGNAHKVGLQEELHKNVLVLWV